MWKRPAQNGAVSTDADHVTLVRADLDSDDRSAVAKANVRHRSFLV